MSAFKRPTRMVRIALIFIAALLLPKMNMASSVLINSTGASDESLFLILAFVALFQITVILVIAGVIKAIASNHEVWKMRWDKGAAVLIGIFLLSGGTAMAQGTPFNEMVSMGDTGFMALIFVNLMLFVTFIYLTSKLNGLLKMMMKDEEGKVPKTFLDKINTMLTDAAPLEDEKSVEMDHEYDGIRELDNNLPPWWLYMFYACIFFAVVYLFHFQVSPIPGLSDWVILGKVEQGNQIDQYKLEMKEAEEAKAAFVATVESVVDESNVELLTEADDIAAGQKIFKLYCGPCHGENGASMPGGVGPNLADDYWIHGGSVTDVYKTIKYGVPSKGMVSWEAQLNPTKIQQVSSFIISLKGTNPENGKEPQGDLYEEVAVPAESPAEDATVDAESTDDEVVEEDVME